MTTEQAWHQLLEIMEKSAPNDGREHGQGQGQIQWLRPNRLVLSGRWPVQARFVVEPGKYSIYFERFDEMMENRDFELLPELGSAKSIAWTMLLEISNGQAFWRVADGQTLTSTVLARRVLARLPEFQSEYAMSILAPAY